MHWDVVQMRTELNDARRESIAATAAAGAGAPTTPVTPNAAALGYATAANAVAPQVGQMEMGLSEWDAGGGAGVARREESARGGGRRLG